MSAVLSPVNGLPAFYLTRESVTLTRLREEREQCVAFVARTLEQVESRDDKNLSDTEKESLNRQKARIGEIDAQIQPLADFEALVQADQRSAAAYRPSTPAHPTPAVYAQPRAHEYASRGAMIVDLLKAHDRSHGGHDDPAARDRLMAARVAPQYVPGHPESYERALANEITSDVPGLLPKPIVGPVNSDLDAARPFVNTIGARDLGVIPGKTFTRPTVTQHVISGKQTAEKTELPSQKYTVGGVDFTKETRGGALDVSRQTMDWTSPGAWDALLADLQDAYALDTEAVAVAAFAAAVVQATPIVATNDLAGWSKALYSAAALAYAGAKRLPNIIFTSLDMWAAMGSIVDTKRLAMRPGDATPLGGSSVTDFGGNVFDLPRVVVPSLPNGTVIVGVKEKTEFYEERIGLLTAVEPRLLGVEIAYGGYVAYGTLVPTAFAKITPPA